MVVRVTGAQYPAANLGECTTVPAVNLDQTRV